MLARSFLTAEQLGIRQDQHDGLLKVLFAMEKGELVHVPSPLVEAEYNKDVSQHLKSQLFLGHFNMGQWSVIGHCGTVCCIGGAAEILGNTYFEESKEPEALWGLFYPHYRSGAFFEVYNSITIDQAQQALNNYLTTGDASWKDILP